MPPPSIAPFCQRCDQAARENCTRGLRRLFDYWEAKRAGPAGPGRAFPGRAFPSRADIDPIEIGSLLPHVFLIDVLPGSQPGLPDFRFRLTGTTVDEIHGQSLTGRSPADIRTPEIALAAERQCRRVIQSRAPCCDHVILLARDDSFWHFERLMLPLSGDGSRIDMLLCGIYAA